MNEIVWTIMACNNHFRIKDHALADLMARFFNGEFPPARLVTHVNDLNPEFLALTKLILKNCSSFII